MNRNLVYAISCALLLLATPTFAQEEKSVYRPQIHGTIRGKYEYQTQDKEGRFEVRTARFSVSGNVLPIVSYKAEIDLCDEGKIKMLDAYTSLNLPFNQNKDKVSFTIGQMRVPFTIDAHRSPQKRYFANRSFIAKQVGDVRDVGCKLRIDANVGFPIALEAGLFNGSGLTNQKDFWSKGINFSTKAQAFFPGGWSVQASVQKIKHSVGIMMYDGGLFYHSRGFHVEGEYLFKHYDKNAFSNVNSYDFFASYDIPIKKGIFKYATPLLRYDYMDDHSDGYANVDGKLFITDYKRHRLTGGVTLSLSKPFVSDIRLNYEKYFYDHDGIPKRSEKDKFVIEFMTKF